MKKFLVTLIFIIATVIFASCAPMPPEGETFCVTFGGDCVNEYIVTVEKNEAVSKPRDPRSEDLHFLYWATADGKQYDFSKPITSDVILYAVWAEEEPEKTYYTVNFYGVNGELISNQRVAEGESANAPAVSTSDYFVFDGWDKDISDITCDMDVYASQRYNSMDANLFTYELNSDLTFSITGVKDGADLPQMAGGYVKLALPTEYNGVEITEIAAGEEFSGAFSRLNLLSVYIPSCYKKIGAYAFYGNPALSQVTFNEGLKEIGKGAFMATFGEGYVLYGRYANSGASAYVSALTEVNLPSSLEKINAYAFNHIGGTFVNGNYILKDVKLTFGDNSQLKKIGRYAFEGVQIYDISLPKTENLYIGDYAFAADTYLNWVYEGSSDYPRSITKRIYIPDSVNNIGNYAFYGLGVKYSYYNGSCWGTKTEIEFVADRLNLDYLGEGAFKYAKLVGSLDLEVQSVAKNAFYGQSLSAINLDKVVTVCDYAFATTEEDHELAVDLGSEVVSIGEGAFSGNKRLNSITLPSTLETIGKKAFYGCEALSQKIQLPASLVDVGESAFAMSGVSVVQALGSTRLKKECFASSTLVSISGNIVCVEEGVFSDCSMLVSAALPTNMTQVPKNLFMGCKSLTEVTLPDTVTTVCKNAFYGCASLTTVTLSENLKVLQDDAFNGCSQLSSVVFAGDSVTTIGNNAFAFCSKLAEIKLPDSVSIIGDCAFRGSGLTTFKTPAMLTCMGAKVFMQEEYLESKVYGIMPISIDSVPKISLPVISEITISKDTGLIQFSSTGTFDDSKITSFNVEDGNKYYSSVDGILYNADKTKLIMYIRDETISGISLVEGLVEICDGAFYGNKFLNNVNLPSTLKVVGNYAFYGCTNLQSVTLPSLVESIGSYAFAGDSYGESELGSIIFAKNATITSIGEGAFSYNKELASVALPSSVVSIGSKAFYNLTSLVALDFSDASSLQYIGKEAFGSDSGSKSLLKSVDFSGCVSLQSTGNYAFVNCDSLELIKFGALSTIDEGSFYGCSSLTSLEVAKSITKIDDSAFRRCFALNEIIIADDSQLLSIGEYAFAGTIFQRVGYSTLDLTKATKLLSIGEYAFAYSDLVSVTLPSSAYILGEDAFASCVNLVSVSLGNGITQIGENVFRCCTKLTHIVIPSSVTTIDSDAFSGLNLVSVDIGTAQDGNSIASMGKRAFFDCKSLVTVNIYGANIPQLEGKMDNLLFYYNESKFDIAIIPSLVVYIDSGMTDSYLSNENETGWEVYADYIVERV